MGRTGPQLSRKRGTIYFALAENGTRVKIGFTQRLRVRMQELNPFGEPLRCAKVIDGTPSMERGLHQRFEHLKIEGEWFRNVDDLAAFLDMAEAK